MRRRLAVATALGLAAATLTRAQEPGAVLHEPVPGARDDEIALVTRGRGDASDRPALLYRGALVDAPDGTAPVDRSREVPMSAVPGDGERSEEPGRRSPTFRPDRQTSLEGRLGYYAAFNPTVAPFKRVTAFDTVVMEDGVPVLAVSDPSVEPIPVLDPAAPVDVPRDRFWGDVVLDFATGTTVPLPLPGPDARLLRVRTEPAVALAFERDDAGNAFARLEDALPARPVRMTFLVDVPQAYFGAALPRAPADVLAEEVAPLPPALRASARSFAAELGLGPGPSLRAALDVLVAHFRSFEESEQPPTDTGDIYLDLARGKRGICRHRAYAFLPTAQALGIPTRFVMNEAHSWVEVKLPGTGWLRVDLGGAAEGLDAFGARDRAMHRPTVDDTLPRPDAYRRSYSQLAGDVSGVPSTRPPFDPEAAGAARGVASGPPATTTSRWSGPRRRAVRLAVDASTYEVLRGRDLTVTGRTTGDDGAGLAGLRIEAVLRGPDREVMLGVAVTDANGFYRGELGVPPDLPTGEYALGLRFPGDARHAPVEVR